MLAAYPYSRFLETGLLHFFMFCNFDALSFEVGVFQTTAACNIFWCNQCGRRRWLRAACMPDFCLWLGSKPPLLCALLLPSELPTAACGRDMTCTVCLMQWCSTGCLIISLGMWGQALG